MSKVLTRKFFIIPAHPLRRSLYCKRIPSGSSLNLAIYCKSTIATPSALTIRFTQQSSQSMQPSRTIKKRPGFHPLKKNGSLAVLCYNHILFAKLAGRINTKIMRDTAFPHWSPMENIRRTPESPESNLQFSVRRTLLFFRLHA